MLVSQSQGRGEGCAVHEQLRSTSKISKHVTVDYVKKLFTCIPFVFNKLHDNEHVQFLFDYYRLTILKREKDLTKRESSLIKITSLIFLLLLSVTRSSTSVTPEELCFKTKTITSRGMLKEVTMSPLEFVHDPFKVSFLLLFTIEEVSIHADCSPETR